MIEFYLIGTVAWLIYCTFNNEGDGYFAGFFQGLMGACVWPIVLVMALIDHIKGKARQEIRKEIENERKDREYLATEE